MKIKRVKCDNCGTESVCNVNGEIDSSWVVTEFWDKMEDSTFKFVAGKVEYHFCSETCLLRFLVARHPFELGSNVQ
jgi:hypothetical protein